LGGCFAAVANNYALAQLGEETKEALDPKKSWVLDLFKQMTKAERAVRMKSEPSSW
jgi:hypothetical protein